MEDSEQCLLDLFRTYKVKSIKNKQENSAMWDILTETYNNATDRNYTKKQLQKRISYISFKEKKKDQLTIANFKFDMEEDEPINNAKGICNRLTQDIHQDIHTSIISSVSGSFR